MLLGPGRRRQDRDRRRASRSAIVAGSRARRRSTALRVIEVPLAPWSPAPSTAASSRSASPSSSRGVAAGDHPVLRRDRPAGPRRAHRGRHRRRRSCEARSRRGDLAHRGDDGRGCVPRSHRDVLGARRRASRPIAVPELDEAATRPILRAVRDRLATAAASWSIDAALDVLLDFADEHRSSTGASRTRRSTCCEQAVAAAIVDGRDDGRPSRRARGHRRLVGARIVDPDAGAVRARPRRAWPRLGSSARSSGATGSSMRSSRSCCVGRSATRCCSARPGRARRRSSRGSRSASRRARCPRRCATSGSSTCPCSRSAAADDVASRRPRRLPAEARHPSVVVFFDEIHLLALARRARPRRAPQAARSPAARSPASAPRPPRSTRRLIEPLGRRSPAASPIIPVEPMDAAAVRAVLAAVRDSLAKQRGVTVDDDALDELVALGRPVPAEPRVSGQGRRLIEQSVAYALTHGQTTVDVALRPRSRRRAMIGMPLDPTEALARSDGAHGRGRCSTRRPPTPWSPAGVSLRGLDARSRASPTRSCCSCGGAADCAPTRSRRRSPELFGRETAVIDIDLVRADRGLVDLDAARVRAGPRRLRPAAAAA